MEFQIGDIFHCSNSGVLSRLIRFFTKSEISHSAIFLEIWGKPYIIDAQKDGVNVRPFDEWVKKYNYNFIVHRTPLSVDLKNIAIRALSQSGHTAYDFHGLLLKHPIKLFTGKYKKSKNELEKMYCSEFVAWVHEIPNSHKLTPGELYETCIAYGFEIIGKNKLK